MKIIDNKTIVATIITMCLLIVFFAFSNNSSYALLSNPTITSFVPENGI